MPAYVALLVSNISAFLLVFLDKQDSILLIWSKIFRGMLQECKYGESEPLTQMFFTLQLDYPVVLAAIFVSGVGGTFQYGFSISVMTSPSVVSPGKSS